MLVIGISSRKKGGKSSLANFLRINADDLWPRGDIVEDWTRPTEVSYLPFAGPFKEFAVRVLGLPENLVYGTDEEKEAKTEYHWEKMPHYENVKKAVIDHNMTVDHYDVSYEGGRGTKYPVYKYWNYKGTYPDHNKLPGYREFPTGPMTVRQILQEIGTGWGRCLDDDIWCKTWERDMLRSGADVVLSDDLRFSNELSFMSKHKAVLIRLLRGRTDDAHVSETSLRDDDPRWSLLIDNRNCTKDEANAIAIEGLTRLGVVQPANAEITLRKNSLWGTR